MYGRKVKLRFIFIVTIILTISLSAFLILKSLEENVIYFKSPSDIKMIKELKNKITQVLDRMEKNIPSHTIPIQSEDLHYQVARIYGDLEEKESMRNILDDLVNRPSGRPLNRVEYANTFFNQIFSITPSP